VGKRISILLLASALALPYKAWCYMMVGEMLCGSEVGWACWGRLGSGLVPIGGDMLWCACGLGGCGACYSATSGWVSWSSNSSDRHWAPQCLSMLPFQATIEGRIEPELGIVPLEVRTGRRGT
jgi:hypothetical protein